MKTDLQVTYALYIQSPNGYKREQVKCFKDEKHFSNWFRYMNKKGYKIIDEQEIK